MATKYYGGQAVIEGVMMRGRKRVAVAVRNPQGELVLHEEPLTAKIYTSRWGEWPFVRGLALLWDALGLGMRALMWSAEVAAQEEEGEPVEFTGPVAWTTIAASLSFAIVIFFLLPTFASRWLASFANDNAIVDAIWEGVIRLVLFVLYIWAIGHIPDIRRVFGYHGAEHKTINAYEAGDALTVESVQRHSVQHKRCGTSFLLYVLVISIILFAPLTFSGVGPTWLALLLRFVTRLLLVPIVAGIAYEIIRFSADHADWPLVGALITPGAVAAKADDPRAGRRHGRSGDCRAGAGAGGGRRGNSERPRGHGADGAGAGGVAAVDNIEPSGFVFLCVFADHYFFESASEEL